MPQQHYLTSAFRGVRCLNLFECTEKYVIIKPFRLLFRQYSVGIFSLVTFTHMQTLSILHLHTHTHNTHMYSLSARITNTSPNTSEHKKYFTFCHLNILLPSSFYHFRFVSGPSVFLSKGEQIARTILMRYIVKTKTQQTYLPITIYVYSVHTYRHIHTVLI